MSTPRPHLVERAAEVLGGITALGTSDRAAAAPVPQPAEQQGAPQQPVAAASPAIGWDALRHAGLVVCDAAGGRGGRVAEEITLVQHQLLRAMWKLEPGDGRCLRSILVTSARPAEGKTFTSVNIAASIAAGSTRRVLLVDADGKQGSLSELLGQTGARGLRALTRPEKRDPTSLILPTAQPRLFVLPYGAAEGEPTRIAGSLVATAIQQLATALPDYILVLDSPPCLATSDPSSLASVVGQVLLVVRAEQTQRSDVEAALDMVDACQHLQLMLNRTRLAASETFVYGNYYGTYGGHAPSSVS